jgi:hypothetical protein
VDLVLSESPDQEGEPPDTPTGVAEDPATGVPQSRRHPSAQLREGQSRAIQQGDGEVGGRLSDQRTPGLPVHLSVPRPPHRQRRTDEIFPWDHISAAVKKSYLFQDFRMSLEGEIRVDCRQHCFACGILPAFSGVRRENPGDYWKCPEVKSPSTKSAVDRPVIGD